MAGSASSSRPLRPASASVARVVGSLVGLLLCFAVHAADAHRVPQDLKNFYRALRRSDGCRNKLASGFYSGYEEGEDSSSSYCGDYLHSHGIIYLQGKGSDLVNMDVDCDGVQGGPADDGRCKGSADTQSVTSFQDVVQEYGASLGHGPGPGPGHGNPGHGNPGHHANLTDLDANVHSYVVFGNTAESGDKPGWPTFLPAEYGVEPLSVMAVVCNDQLFYGVWGDENGDDGDHPMVGETSISLATACFGKDEEINGDSGHDGNDVLYVAFTGKSAVPGARGARWLARNFEDFERSLRPLGSKLIERIPKRYHD